MNRLGGSTEVTEEEVTALFDEDGNLSEQTDDQETDEPEADDEEPQEEEAEADEEESESEEETEEELDWEAVDPRYKAAFEKFQSEAQKWQKDYGKIQSKWTKASQAQKEFESTRERLMERDQLLSRFEQALENNPKLVEMFKRELHGKADPFEDTDVPDYLKQDPAFKYVQERYLPVIRGLQQQIQEMSGKVSKVDEWEQQTTQAKYKEQLDNQLDAAKEQIKSIFGREAEEEELTQVLEFMVENKFYSNGKAAALAVFQDQQEKAVRDRIQRELKEKAKKFPSRQKSVNPSRAKESSNAQSVEDAIRMSLAEQGY